MQQLIQNKDVSSFGCHFGSGSSNPHLSFLQVVKFISETKYFLDEFDTIISHWDLSGNFFLYYLIEIHEGVTQLLARFTTLSLDGVGSREHEHFFKLQCCGVGFENSPTPVDWSINALILIELRGMVFLPSWKLVPRKPKPNKLRPTSFGSVYSKSFTASRICGCTTIRVVTRSRDTRNRTIAR